MDKINLDLASKINKYLKKEKKPLIVLISGVNSAGKTTTAFHLSSALGIKQRVGLGSIVKTLIALGSDREKKKYLMMDNFFSHPPNHKELLDQCYIVGKVVNLIINKYTQEGVTCIIEGVQLLPRYLNSGGNVKHFHILIDDFRKYRKQLKNGNTRKYRKIGGQSFKNLVKLNALLRKEAVLSEVNFLYNSKSKTVLVNKILENIARDLGVIKA